MIGTVARMTIRPGTSEQFEFAARQMVEEARVRDGCVFFGLFRSDKPNGYVFMGRWGDAAIAGAYSSPARFNVQFRAFIDGEAEFVACPEL
ncbi:MAG: putative quinol monooxygenase [Sphingomonadales bacterium]